MVGEDSRRHTMGNRLLSQLGGQEAEAWVLLPADRLSGAVFPK